MRLLFSLFTFFCLLSACDQNKHPKTHKQLSSYDLNLPQVLKLPLQLDEISGLAYVPKDNTLLAINDETGVLYKVDVHRPGYIQQWRFGPPGDYEGVAIADSFVYVLRSDGAIIQIHFKNKDTVVTRQFPFPQKGNEFESLAYLKSRRSLLLICKACVDDDKETFSWYHFNLDSMKLAPGRYRFPIQKIEKLLNYEKKRFKASAVAVHPITSNYYLLSAVNKAIVVVNEHMQVVEAVPLSGPAFIQPEGIDFDSAGNMFISNETNKVQAANILVFPYHPSH